jgi:hypothetical protein
LYILKIYYSNQNLFQIQNNIEARVKAEGFDGTNSQESLEIIIYIQTASHKNVSM